MITLLALLPTGRPASCAHPVFCNQTLLEALGPLFPEAKDFVDSYLARPVEQVLAQFQTLSDLPQKVRDNFIQSDQYILPFTPPDFREDPPLIQKLESPQLKQLAAELNRRWNLLSKTLKRPAGSSCRVNCSTIPDEYFRLAEEEGWYFVFPGGRFRESYYWDTYWIVRGLLACDMWRSATQAVDVLIRQVSRLGFVPNGLRIYYEGRSQPPLLARTVKAVLDYLLEKGLAEEYAQLKTRALPAMVREFGFWMTNRSALLVHGGRIFNVSRYSSAYDQPRPQVYGVDAALLKQVEEPRRSRLGLEINAAAESGWDFSTRWTANSSSSLLDLQTSQVVGSDLNFYVGEYASILAQMVPANPSYKKIAELVKIYFHSIYRQQDSFFPDLNLKTEQPVLLSKAAALLPHLLLATDKALLSPTIIALFQQYPTPPPTTESFSSGLQWDGYNVWAPNVHALYELGTEAKRREVAGRWLRNVACGWRTGPGIMQKYDSRGVGRQGGGGEYVVQEGFGWTNGLALLMMRDLPELQAQPCL